MLSVVVASDAGVPVEDRQLAVALLMELSVQRGALSDMLSAVRLHLLVVVVVKVYTLLGAFCRCH